MKILATHREQCKPEEPNIKDLLTNDNYINFKPAEEPTL